MRNIGRFLICILLLLIPVFALAAETPGDAVATFLDQVLFPVLTAFLIGMVGILLNKVRQKYNVQISQETEEYLTTLAKQGVARAEEVAANYVKKTTNEKLASRDKLSIAVATVLSAAPKITPEKADAIVHAALAKMEGVGATGFKTVQ